MTISDVFRINGVDTISEQNKILNLINSKIPSKLWNAVLITSIQELILTSHGYKIEEIV